ncbi:hypothetical protein DNTS_023458, partial [Danionella cerebrum]
GSEVLEHILSAEDVWPTDSCRGFMLEWASLLDSMMRPMQTDGWPESRTSPDHALGSDLDTERAKRAILSWTRELRALPEQSVCLRENVQEALQDLEAQWRRGRMETLCSALELLLWSLLCRDLNTAIWDWICEAEVDVTLDQDSANPDLLISSDERQMRCGFQRRDVPNTPQLFDSWWCAVGTEGFSCGRQFWMVELGEMDWRIGVAKESALRKGFKSLNTETGYLSLRLERGSELKALTVPFTALPATLIPLKVGVYLDFDQGQLSFYDTEKRSHIYTYNESFEEKLFPLFGTVEIVRNLVIRAPGGRKLSFCPGMCMRD